ncbi:MAG TPA: glycerophosphoryl diester phosphodiesterase [Gammaproteobacteria bacterium]|nr:glycerophosphoryl diester phosphodiesterase [Gammaproteobacteria bacterium]
MIASTHFNPPVIAHRGASAYAPENTMSSFVKAVQLGIHWVEFDVMLAKCGTPVIIHDETLDRTTSGSGNVIDYPYSYLYTLDAGGWFAPEFSGERIPSLEQMAQFMTNTGLCANVEIKPHPGQEDETVIAALKIMRNYFPDDSEKIIYSSFSIASLRCLRLSAPQCRLGFLMHEWIPEWRKIVYDLNCETVNVNHEILTPERVSEIKQSGKMLLSYTVDDPQRAAELMSWGVDVVFSNVPDQIARFGYHPKSEGGASESALYAPRMRR